MTRHHGPLSETDEKLLTNLSERGGRHRERAQVVLLSASGQRPTDVARALGLTVPTVYKWQKRFRQEGVAGLQDRARPGQPRRLSQARRDELLRISRDELPRESPRWTIRSLAKACAVTQHQVRAVWHEHGLARHHVSANMVGTTHDAPGGAHLLTGLLLAPPVSVAVFALEGLESEPGDASSEPTPPVQGAVRLAFQRAAAGASRGNVDATALLFAFMAQVRAAHPVQPLRLVFASPVVFTLPQLMGAVTSRAGIHVSAWPRADAWVESLEACIAHALVTSPAAPQARAALDLLQRLHGEQGAQALEWVRGRMGLWERGAVHVPQHARWGEDDLQNASTTA